jgi:hypothetical protein
MRGQWEVTRGGGVLHAARQDRPIPASWAGSRGTVQAMPLAQLPDSARLLLVPSDPPLAGTDLAGLLAQVDKLFAQFAREGKVSAWGAEALAGGAILGIAWDGDADLSGCSRDLVARLLMTHEERSGRRLLSAPPIVVAARARTACVDRAGLRRLVATGEAGGETPVYDLRCATIGAWRAAPTRALAAGPLAGVLAAAS